MNSHYFSKLLFQKRPDILHFNVVWNSANKNLSFCEGFFDANSLLVDCEIFQSQNFLKFGGWNHKKSLVLSLLLAENDILGSQLSLGK